MEYNMIDKNRFPQNFYATIITQTLDGLTFLQDLFFKNGSSSM